MPRWTIRLLVPRPLSTARLAYLHAAREHLATPLHPSAVAELEWFFLERQRLAAAGTSSADDRFQKDTDAFCAPRFRALYRQWVDDPSHTLWMARSTALADAVERGHGQLECVELSRQYLHLSPLVAIA